MKCNIRIVLEAVFPMLLSLYPPFSWRSWPHFTCANCSIAYTNDNDDIKLLGNGKLISLFNITFRKAQKKKSGD